VIKTYEILKNFLFFVIFCFSYPYVNAGLNNFTDLIFVEDWLIERKVDLTMNEIQCRASIPTHANWFGDRIRLGDGNQLIKPIWTPVKEDQLLDSKLAKVKKLLEECRAGFLFLPDEP
jgi:hypothetical protein